MKTKNLDKLLSSSLARRKEEESNDSIDMNAPVDTSLIEPKKVKEVSVDQLRAIYPIKVSDTVLENCAKEINNSLGSMNSIEQGIYKENVFNFLDILTDSNNKSGIKKYLNAVKFCMYKMQGNTDVRAYAMTFPDKIQRMADEKIPNSYLYAYAQAYSKSQIVVKIITKMMIPAHIQFQDIFSKAVMTQAEIMQNDKVSPKVRSDAANSLMTHLKQPEIKQMELQIGTKDNGAINSLAEALSNLSNAQRDLMLSGKYTSKELREATIIEVNENE